MRFVFSLQILKRIGARVLSSLSHTAAFSLIIVSLFLSGCRDSGEVLDDILAPGLTRPNNNPPADIIQGLSLKNSIVQVSSETVGASSSISVESGEFVFLTLESKDNGGNRIVVPGLSVFFLATPGPGMATGEISPAFDNGNGTYTSTFRGAKTGSPVQISAFVNSNLVTSPKPTVSVLVGKPSVLHSQIFFEGEEEGDEEKSLAFASNVEKKIRIRLKDYGGNPIAQSTYAPDLSFAVVARGVSNAEFGVVEPVAGKDGTYVTTIKGTISGTPSSVIALWKGVQNFNDILSFTIRPGDPESISVLSGNSQTAIVDNQLDSPLIAVVKDHYGNLVPDVRVDWDVIEGSGSTSVSYSTTDQDGKSDTSYRVGTLIGSGHRVRAKIHNTTFEAEFQASATHGQPEQLAFIQHPTSTLAGYPIAPTVVVQVQDAFGNPVTTGSGASSQVTMTLSNGAGVLGGTKQVSAVEGQASFSDLKVSALGAVDILTASAILSDNLRTVNSNLFSVTGQRYSSVFSFESSNQSDFSFDDTKVSFDDVASLIGFSFKDETQEDFLQGVSEGLVYETGAEKNYLRINPPQELSAEWTPQYEHIVGYWKLNGAGSLSNGTPVAAVIGPNGNALNDNSSGMSYVEGAINEGVTFDGDDRISMGMPPASFNFGTSTDFSVMIWANFTENRYMRFITDGHTGFSNGFMLNYAGNGALFGIGGSQGTHVRSVNTFHDGKWHQFIGVFDRTQGKQILYVDGAPVPLANEGGCGSVQTNYIDISSCAEANATGSSQLTIGSIAASTSEIFEGKLDEAAVWATALTPNEVEVVYQRQAAARGVYVSRVMDSHERQDWEALRWKTTRPTYKELPDNGLSETTSEYSKVSANLMAGSIALWHLNEQAPQSGSFNDFKDSSVNTNSGEAVNGLTFGATGQFISSASLNGSNQYIRVADSASLQEPSNGLTMSSWINISTYSNSNWVVSKNNWSPARGYGFLVESGWVWPHIAINGTVRNPTSSERLQANQWYFVAITYDGSFIKIYVNGRLDSSFSYAGTITQDDSELRIGNNPASSSEYFGGSIDEVGLWSRALSEAEVFELYRRKATRIGFQIRTCDTNPCNESNDSWKGPDNTDSTYFTELNNNNNRYGGSDPVSVVKVGSPQMDFLSFDTPGISGLAKRYIQYKAVLESDVNGDSPELRLVEILGPPAGFATDDTEIVSSVPLNFNSLESFTEILGGEGCTGEPRYLVSNNRTTWYHSNGTQSTNGTIWIQSTDNAGSGSYADADPESVVSRDLPLFAAQFGVGDLYIKAFLKSDGLSPCQLVGLNVAGSNEITVDLTTATRLSWNPAPSRNGKVGVSLPVFRVEVMDSNGNLLVTDNSTEITITSSGSGDLTNGSSSLTQTVTAGVATFESVTYDTIETMSIQASALGLPNLTRKFVEFQVGPVSHAETILSGPTFGGINYPIELVVTPKDFGGNLLPIGIDSLTFDLAPSSSGAGAFSSVVLQGNGQYTTSFSGTALGPVLIRAIINGQPIDQLLSVVILPNTSFTQTYEFNEDTSEDYTSDGIVVFDENSVLIPNLDFIDSNSETFGAAGSVSNGVSYDTSAGNTDLDGAFLKLSASTNLSELSESWTPRWPPAAYWKLNGAGTLSSGQTIDSSLGSGPTLQTAGGSLQYTSPANNGKLRDAITLDGNGNYLSMSAAPSGDEFTFIGWVYWRGGNPWQRIFDIGQNTSRYFFLSPRSDSNTLRAAITDGSGEQILNAGMLDTNRWVHVGVTLDGSIGKLFVNGQVVDVRSITLSPSDVAGSANYLGKSQWDDPYFNGSLDEIAFWNSALTEKEIHHIYMRQAPKYAGSYTSRVLDGGGAGDWTGLLWKTGRPAFKELPVIRDRAEDYSKFPVGVNLSNGLVGLWHMNGSETASLADSSGNGNNASVLDGPLKKTDGLFHEALSIDGASAEVPHSSSLNLSNAWTISTWVYQTSYNGGDGEVIFGEEYQGTPIQFCIGYCASGQITAAIYAPGWYLSPGYTLPNGVWTHLVGMYSGAEGTLKLYVDGVLIGTTTGVPSTSPGGALPKRIGRRWDSQEYFRGRIDELGLWNRTLSAAEITELYERGTQRLRIQVRSCSTNPCNDETDQWYGPDNTNKSYFSELNNNSNVYGGGSVLPGSPALTFADFASAPLSIPNRRYFQYRAILESNSASNGPELQRVEPTGPPGGIVEGNPSLTMDVPVNFATLSSLTEILGPQGCSGTPRFILSLDKTQWYHHRLGSWLPIGGSPSYSDGNTEKEVTDNFPDFASVGTGQVYVRVYLDSNGGSTCSISGIAVSGSRPTNTTVGAVVDAIAWNPAPLRSVVAGESFEQFGVQLVDSNGYLITNSGAATVSLSVSPGNNSYLSDTSAHGVTSGTAFFSSISYTKAESITLTATESTRSRRVHREITVLPAAATTANTSLSGSNEASVNVPITVTLSVRDQFGNLTSSGISSLAFSVTEGVDGGNGTIDNGAITNPSTGIYRASFLATAEGTATIGASLNGLSIPGFDVEIVYGVTQLVFVTQPTTVEPHNIMTPAVVVEARDAHNQVVPDFNSEITLRFGGGSPPSSDKIFGKTVNAINGVATYSGISIASDVKGNQTFIAETTYESVSITKESQSFVVSGVETHTLNSSSTPQWNSIISYWPLKGEGAVAGTVPAVVGDSAIVDGSGMVFNSGSEGIKFRVSNQDGYLRVFPQAINGLTEGTLSMWVKTRLDPNPDGGLTGLVHFGTDNNHYPYSNGLLYLSLLRSGRIDNIQNNFDKSVWHHLAVTTSPGSNNYHIYQNANDILTTNGDSSFNLQQNSMLGRSDCCWFDGSLAQIALWDKALTPSEIETLYNLQKDSFKAFPTQLRFIQQPRAQVVDSAISPDIKVAVVDSEGAVVSGGNQIVTLSLSEDSTPGATLSGTISVPVVDGIAVFKDISINQPGDYKLVAKFGLLTSAISRVFRIDTSVSPSDFLLLNLDANQSSESQQAYDGTSCSGSALTWYDLSISDADGTLHDFPSTCTGASGWFGDSPKALSFSNYNHIRIPKQDVFKFSSEESFTLSVWFSPNSEAQPQWAKLLRTDYPGGFQFTFIDRKLGIHWRTNSRNDAAIFGEGNISVTRPGDWYLLNATFDRGGEIPTVKIFVNGQEQGSYSGSNAIGAFDNPSDFIIGGDRLNGKMAQFQIYSRALTPSEIASKYSSEAGSYVSEPVRLGFVSQPSLTQVDTAMSPPVVLELQDSAGIRVSSSGSPNVSLAISGTGANLNGASVSASDGLAVFDGLSVDQAGADYTLTASSSGLTPVVSNTFSIVADAPALEDFLTVRFDASRASAIETPFTGTDCTGSALGWYDVGPSKLIAELINFPETCSLSEGWNLTHLPHALSLKRETSMRVQVPYSPVLDFGAYASFTTSIWISPYTTSQYDWTGLLAKVTDWAEPPFWQLVLINSRPFLNYQAAGRDNREFGAEGSIAIDTPGKWYLVSMVVNREDGSIRLYVNGVLQSEDIDTFNNTGSFEGNGYFRIGTERGGNAQFNGKIGLVEVFGKALSESQIQSKYNTEKLGFVGEANSLEFSVQPRNSQVNSGMLYSPKVRVLDENGFRAYGATTSVSLSLNTDPSGSATLNGSSNVSVSAIDGIADFAGVVIDQIASGFRFAANSTGLSEALSSTFDVVSDPIAVDFGTPSLWYKADAITGLSNGDKIAVWPDSSGNGNNGVMSDPYRQPVYIASAVNGHPSVFFGRDGNTSKDADGGGNTISFTTALNDIVTVIAVIQHETGNQNHPGFIGDSGNPDYYHFHMGGGTELFGIWAAPSLRNGEVYKNSELSSWNTSKPKDYTVITIVSNTTGGYVNNGDFTDGKLFADGLSRNQWWGDRSWDGEIPEIIIYNYVLDPSDRQFIELHLKDKYGID